jgi:hypothetical protein
MLVRRASVMRACSLLVIRQMWYIPGLYSPVSIGSLSVGSIERHPLRKAKLHVQLIRIVTNTPYLDAILSKPET